MILVLTLVLFLLVTIAPSYWVKWVIRRNSADDPSLPGTGAEIAEHFKQRFELPITVEVTDQGDHYHPIDKAVRLSEANFNGRSLAAITVATHEIGHALQDQEDDQRLRKRAKLAEWAVRLQRYGIVLILAVPLLSVLFRVPSVGVIMFLAGFALLAPSVIIHLATLPVEWDASFNKALPILWEGNYLTEAEFPKAKKILLAAALTYVSAALVALVNVWFWIRILRF